MEKLKVAVWGTGGISSIAVRCLADRRDVEVVGVWAHAETAGDKIGTDAGLLYGDKPIGVTISGEEAEVMALQPDCAFVGLNPQDNEGVVIPLFERLLAAGINVVGTSSANLMYPPAYPIAASRERLEKAAAKGGASLYISGIDPGFAADQFICTLLTCVNTIKSVRIQELFMYDTYPDEMMMKYAFGFGMPMDFEPKMSEGGMQRYTWGPPVEYVAAALGYKLDDVRETYERRKTDRDLQVAMGMIPAGTVGAVRFETIGVVEGREAIIIEHVNRMDKELAPEWSIGPRDGTYRVIIEGDPNMSCEMYLGANNQTAGYEGMVVTCMRAANAIPYVCNAAPGLLSSMDLPLTLPTDAFRSDNTVPQMKGYGGN